MELEDTVLEISRIEVAAQKINKVEKRVTKLESSDIFEKLEKEIKRVENMIAN